MRKKQYVIKPRTGIGWVGFWNDGTIGWAMPPHIDPRYPAALYESGHDRDYVREGDEFVRCRIIIEPLLDARGRLIVRRMKKQQS